MEANLVGDAGAKTKRTFPYANWGPGAAILGVLAALAVGIFLSVPAIFVGGQKGEIEARFPPGFTTSASFDEGDATAIAVDPRNHSLYADHESEIRVFGAGGEEIEIEGQIGVEDSHGLAFDPRNGTLYISEEEAGRITAYRAGGARPGHVATIERAELDGEAGQFAPERMAVGPDGDLYVIDALDQLVMTFDADGRSLGPLGGTGGSSSIDFGAHDNDIAVDTQKGAGSGDVFVLSGKGDGKVLAFAPNGKLLWELEPESNDEFSALTVDSAGDLWIAEPGGDVYEYGDASRAGKAPERTGRKIDAGDEITAISFSGGHLFVARELDSTLNTLGNVLSQIATALGFLLVPIALAATRGAKSFREIFARLGLRGFDRSALKWMGLTVVLYLAFNFFYSTVITEPHQRDIAKGFGSIPIQVILIVVAAPVSEELCFRGMLFGGLREKLPRIVAAVICGLIFGALHALTGVSAVPPLIVFGFLLALLYEKTGSIIPGMLLHMLNNIVALASQ
jgi:membrane protease YdiL (CAAX protease family)